MAEGICEEPLDLVREVRFIAVSDGAGLQDDGFAPIPDYKRLTIAHELAHLVISYSFDNPDKYDSGEHVSVVPGEPLPDHLMRPGFADPLIQLPKYIETEVRQEFYFRVTGNTDRLLHRPCPGGP